MEQKARHDIVQILAAGQDMTVATTREDGWPQATVVSYVSDGLSIYFGCSADSQKARNLTRDPRASIAITLPYGQWDEIRGVSLAGLAQRITDPDQALEIGRLFLEKFPQVGQAFDASEGGGLALFCVTPTVVSILDYRQGFGHTQLVEAGELEIEPA